MSKSINKGDFNEHELFQIGKAKSIIRSKELERPVEVMFVDKQDVPVTETIYSNRRIRAVVKIEKGRFISLNCKETYPEIIPQMGVESKMDVFEGEEFETHSILYLRQLNSVITQVLEEYDSTI